MSTRPKHPPSSTQDEKEESIPKGEPIWAQIAEISKASEIEEKKEINSPKSNFSSSSSFPSSFAPQAQTPEASNPNSEPNLKRGDWIAHPKFGMCKVDGFHANGGTILRLEGGRRKIIRLDIFELKHRTKEKKKRVFDLRSRS